MRCIKKAVDQDRDQGEPERHRQAETGAFTQEAKAGELPLKPDVGAAGEHLGHAAQEEHRDRGVTTKGWMPRYAESAP